LSCEQTAESSFGRARFYAIEYRLAGHAILLLNADDRLSQLSTSATFVMRGSCFPEGALRRSNRCSLLVRSEFGRRSGLSACSKWLGAPAVRPIDPAVIVPDNFKGDFSHKVKLQS
jgi:hypothetical protein